MKVIAVLKCPNIDVIADVDDKCLESYNVGKQMFDFKNVCVVQWLSDYVKIIPFGAAKDCNINMPHGNIAMMFEADKKIGEIHDEELKKTKKAFLSKAEFDAITKEREDKKAEIVNRNK